MPGIEYACVREEVCRYSSVSEENEREAAESSFMRSPLILLRERFKNNKIVPNNFKTKKTKEREIFTIYLYP